MKRLILILLIFGLLTGCSAGENHSRETVFAMDTVMDLQVWGADSQDALTQLQAEITLLEGKWSATDDDSLVGRLNDGGVVLNENEHNFIQRARDLSQRTDGAFDPQLGGYIQAWGFYNGEYRVPSGEELHQVPTQWDLGGIVKGYTGYRLTEILDTLNVDRAILNLGGNVQTYGEKTDHQPWQIAIQNPEGGTLGNLAVLGTMAVVTSGDYQRYFEQDGKKYHHILDPETGYPADSGLSSVTVVCSDGTLADALSTALFVMGMEKAVAHWRQYRDFGMVLLTKDGSLYATENVVLTDCAYEVISYEK